MSSDKTPIKIGDTVKIRYYGGAVLRGLVKDIRVRKVWMTGDYTEYGVELEGKVGITSYYEETFVIKSEDGYIWNAVCTCGAVKTYDPYPPPGHAYHCDLEVNKRIWGC